MRRETTNENKSVKAAGERGAARTTPWPDPGDIDKGGRGQVLTTHTKASTK